MLEAIKLIMLIRHIYFQFRLCVHFIITLRVCEHIKASDSIFEVPLFRLQAHADMLRVQQALDLFWIKFQQKTRVLFLYSDISIRL